MAAAAAAVGTQLTPVYSLGIALSLTLTPALPPTPAINRLMRHRESLTMNKRRTELAETGEAAVMSSLVRAWGENHEGEGATLLEITRSEWEARNAAVILYPANTRLVGFYAKHGAVIDDGAHQRMIYSFQLNATNPPLKPLRRGRWCSSSNRL